MGWDGWDGWYPGGWRYRAPYGANNYISPTHWEDCMTGRFKSDGVEKGFGCCPRSKNGAKSWLWTWSEVCLKDICFPMTYLKQNTISMNRCIGWHLIDWLNRRNFFKNCLFTESFRSEVEEAAVDLEERNNDYEYDSFYQK